MVEIQSATAEIWRGNKVEEQQQQQQTTGQKYNDCICYAGRP